MNMVTTELTKYYSCSRRWCLSVELLIFSSNNNNNKTGFNLIHSYLARERQAACSTFGYDPCQLRT
jgi:hypothetical protein